MIPVVSINGVAGWKLDQRDRMPHNLFLARKSFSAVLIGPSRGLAWGDGVVFQWSSGSPYIFCPLIGFRHFQTSKETRFDVMGHRC